MFVRFFLTFERFIKDVMSNELGIHSDLFVLLAWHNMLITSRKTFTLALSIVCQSFISTFMLLLCSADACTDGQI